jgi:hypothetical protein
VAELLELSYAMDYVVVGGGAIYAAAVGTDAVAHYWSPVLASELASFAPMPWLRSRPPRAVDPPSVAAAIRAKPPTARRVAFRRLNTFILDGASIQANTLPSGHVSGAVAAALGIMAVDVVVGWWLMGAAGLIAVAAVAGRDPNLVACVSGAAVALMLWTLM